MKDSRIALKKKDVILMRIIKITISTFKALPGEFNFQRIL